MYPSRGVLNARDEGGNGAEAGSRKTSLNSGTSGGADRLPWWLEMARADWMVASCWAKAGAAQTAPRSWRTRSSWAARARQRPQG